MGWGVFRPPTAFWRTPKNIDGWCHISDEGTASGRAAYRGDPKSAADLGPGVKGLPRSSPRRVELFIAYDCAELFGWPNEIPPFHH